MILQQLERIQLEMEMRGIPAPRPSEYRLGERGSR